MPHVLQRSSTTLSRMTATLLGTALLVSACGGSGSDDATAEAEATTTEAEPTTTEATETTDPPTTQAETSESDTTAGASESATVEVVLDEWTLVAPANIPAGTVEITARNDGEFGHEFAIIRGDSFDALPKIDNGAADEAALGDALIGRTEVFDGGASVTTTFDLEPGTYVFLCNINFGPNSHAAQGQVQTVVVG